MNIDKSANEYLAFKKHEFTRLSQEGTDHPTNAAEILKASLSKSQISEKENLFTIDYPMQFQKKFFSLPANYTVKNVGFDLAQKEASLSDHQAVVATISADKSDIVKSAVLKTVKSLSGMSSTEGILS